MFQVSNSDIKKIQETLYGLCRIHIADTKSTMIKNRLNTLMKDPRLKGVESAEELLNLVKTNQGIRQSFINSFTTNKTDFFREAYHFEDMLDRSMGFMLKDNKSINIMCSASSSGEEAYSIAATCLYAKNLFKSSSHINIVATDIDTSMLEIARKGEYLFNKELNKLPQWVELDKYFDIKEQSSNKILEIRAKQPLKNMIKFQQLNLFDRVYPFKSSSFEIIFCRNMLIYFKVEDQQEVLGKLFDLLKTHGTLYLGHSEDAVGLSKKVDRLGNKIFIKRAA